MKTKDMLPSLHHGASAVQSIVSLNYSTQISHFFWPYSAKNQSVPKYFCVHKCVFWHSWRTWVALKIKIQYFCSNRKNKLLAFLLWWLLLYQFNNLNKHKKLRKLFVKTNKCLKNKHVVIFVLHKHPKKTLDPHTFFFSSLGTP